MPTYSPDDVVFNLGGVRITGYADGTMIKVSYSTDRWKTDVGGDGLVTRIKSLDRRATITFSIKKEAPIVDHLNTLMKNDDEDGSGKVAADITNLNSKTLHNATEAWIVKPPDDEYATDASSYEFTVECAALESEYAGADR